MSHTAIPSDYGLLVAIERYMGSRCHQLQCLACKYKEYCANGMAIRADMAAKQLRAELLRAAAEERAA